MICRIIDWKRAFKSTTSLTINGFAAKNMFLVDTERITYWNCCWQSLVFSLSCISAHSCSASNTNHQNLNILFQNSSGVLKTPGYPSPYPVGLVENCLWRIVAPKGQVIRLEFLSIRLGKGFICCLEIDDGGRKISKCHTQPSPLSLYSKSRELTLKVKTSLSLIHIWRCRRS